ncbi:flagellar basal body-associated FliL family protein [Alphaproteobacteria bacterium]|nr:flagellar basal body-associated FliL family protein [Alphaproteobacteria bacterium]
MLAKVIGKLTSADSKVMILMLIAGPVLAIATIFIISHLLFVPKQPSSEEIVQSIARKAKLGGIDPALVGVSILPEDSEPDNKTKSEDIFSLVPSKYLYYKIFTTFVTNIKGEKETVVRADLAVSTYLKVTEAEAYAESMTAMSPVMSSAVFIALGETSITDYKSSKSLDQTAEKLKAAINKALNEKNAPYLVDYVHFFELAHNEG